RVRAPRTATVLEGATECDVVHPEERCVLYVEIRQELGRCEAGLQDRSVHVRRRHVAGRDVLVRAVGRRNVVVDVAAQLRPQREAQVELVEGKVRRVTQLHRRPGGVERPEVIGATLDGAVAGRVLDQRQV